MTLGIFDWFVATISIGRSIDVNCQRIHHYVIRVFTGEIQVNLRNPFLRIEIVNPAKSASLLVTSYHEFSDACATFISSSHFFVLL